MKNVIRLQEPLSLLQNAATWKENLLAKIEECSMDGSKVPDKFYSRYKQDDVKNTLETMYGALCCYCEVPTGVVEFGHIEHRKPKKKYPENTFDWNNIHLACTRCNTNKGDKYSETAPILDAVNDLISEHMTYEVEATGVWWMPLTQRGRTTEEHADLNRPRLREYRRNFFLDVMKLILIIRSDRNAPGVKVVMTELEEMAKGMYGSVITFAKQQLL